MRQGLGTVVVCAAILVALGQVLAGPGPRPVTSPAPSSPASPGDDLRLRVQARLRMLFKTSERLQIQYAVLLASRYRALEEGGPLDAGVRRERLSAILADSMRSRTKAGPLPAVGATRLVDEGPRASLLASLESALAQVKRSPQEWLPQGTMRVRRSDVEASLAHFLSLARRIPSSEGLAQAVARDFDVYQSPGTYGTREVLVTVYAEPLVEGRSTRRPPFVHPVYSDPRPRGIQPGALTRPAIRRGVLSDKGLEIAFVREPLEVFSLQVEGSGTIRLDGGRHVRVTYATHNGRRYRSLASLLVRDGCLEPWQGDWDTVRAFFRAHPEVMDSYLDQSPGYVFFSARTTAGPRHDPRLTPGRSIAVDLALLPRPGLYFVTSRILRIGPDGRPAAWEPLSRFVVAQDTGGAIKGLGHIDLYLGAGPEAYAVSGHQREAGALYVLVRKGTKLRGR